MRLRRRRHSGVELDLGARRGPVRPVDGTEATDRAAEQLGVAPAAEPEARRRALAGALVARGAQVPPEGVHAMTRGVEHLAGGLRHADLVLAAAGGPPPAGGRGLDFGCSSGRVVRALALARPDVEWHACDPNQGAIEWAGGHLPGISFAVSPQHPPLPYPSAHFDLVAAISIWSHYGSSAARSWLAEMHRLTRPGGVLVLTAHGEHSLALFARQRLRPGELLARAAAALHANGHFFHDEFGPRGDAGVRHPEWGLAFFTLEWLAAEVTPRWSIERFAPGAADGNQDVIVLARR
jgi:SAM-dependent methyltransferase